MTDVQVKIVHSGGGCRSEDAARLSLDMNSAGALLDGTNEVASLELYFSGTPTTFTLTLTGTTTSIEPYLGDVAFAWPASTSTPPPDPDPNFPTTGGLTWSKSSNELTLVFHAPNLDNDGDWQLSAQTPAVPLTVKVKRRGLPRSGACSTWS